MFSALWANGMGPDGSNCVEFDGFYGFDVDAAAFANAQPDMTIAVWLKGNHPDYPDYEMLQQMRVFQGVWTNAQSQTMKMNVSVPWTNYNLLFNVAGIGGYGISVEPDSPSDFEGQWVHYAFVRSLSSQTLKMYKNGVLTGEQAIAPEQNSDLPAFSQFAIASLAPAGGTISNYVGYMDDFRIYDYELSQGQIMTLAGIEDALTVPVEPAVDVVEDGVIDFNDFAQMASIWLEGVQLWP
jgi:hypothetical protein